MISFLNPTAFIITGLGTSSILAGAIMACLFTVSGRKCDNSSIVHSVSYEFTIFLDLLSNTFRPSLINKERQKLTVSIFFKRFYISNKCLPLEVVGRIKSEVN